MDRNGVGQHISIKRALVCLLALPLLMGQVCQVQPPEQDQQQQQQQNNAPVASAGTNQNVAGGVTVNLDGSASTDPDGDALTFSWTQAGGTNVTLNNANAATPSFVSPNATGTLTFQLTVSDGSLTGSDTVNVTVTTSPTLFITNFTGNGVVAYDISSPQNINGNIPPDANLAGAQTLLASPSDVIVDAGGALLVSNFNTPSITGYDDAVDLSGINGNVAPQRNVQGAATQLIRPTSLAVNTSNDLAFVADQNANAVSVFANASTAALNGNLAPTRRITSANLSTPVGINFGANDELYVANNGVDGVVVFANASNLNGNVAATRILTNAAFTDTLDVFVDANDTLFVVNRNPARIDIFNDASTLNGAVMPDFTLSVQGGLSLGAIAVDSAGNGYITDSTANAVYGYNSIATRNGTLPPDRTLQGANTQLNGPIRLFLLE